MAIYTKYQNSRLCNFQQEDRLIFFLYITQCKIGDSLIWLLLTPVALFQ